MKRKDRPQPHLLSLIMAHHSRARRKSSVTFPRHSSVAPCKSLNRFAPYLSNKSRIA
jgi:hypothetical protein